jgi:hypothetical protein
VQRLRSDRGELDVWQVAPRIFATRAQGFITRDLTQQFIRHVDPVYASAGTVYGFHDWIAMSNYESACRIELTAWLLKHRKQTVLHVAVASRIVAMGVAVANLALGNLVHVHWSVANLEKALAETLANTTR